MTAHVKDAGTWKQLVGLHVKDAGTWKEVLAGYVRDGGTWKQFYGSGGGGGGGSLTASFASGTVTYSRSAYAWSGTVTSLASNVPALTVTGSTGVLTYSWSRISAASASGAFSILEGTTATPRWRVTTSDGVDPYEIWRLTVTDSTGATGYADLTVQLSFYSTI